MILIFGAVLFVGEIYGAEYTSGECTVTISDDGTTVTISGNGDMENYTSPMRVPWIGTSQTNTDITKVVIEDGVTSIGNIAFYGCINLESITIPGSVTKIGDYAFYGCDNLKFLTLPAGVTEIGNYAFQGSGLYKLTVLGRNDTGACTVGSNIFSGTDFEKGSGDMYCYDNSTLGKTLYDNAAGKKFYVNFLNDAIEIRNVNADDNKFEVRIDTLEFGEKGAKYIDSVSLMNDILLKGTIIAVIDPRWDGSIVDINSNSVSDNISVSADENRNSTENGIAVLANEDSNRELIKDYYYEDNDRYIVFKVEYTLSGFSGYRIPVRAVVASKPNMGTGDVTEYYSSAVWIE